MGRSALVLAIATVLAFPAVAGAAARPEPRAEVLGVKDRALRQEIERAVGEERGPPASRIEARRRARDAAVSAIAMLRTEGYYDYDVESDIGEGAHPVPLLRIDVGPRTVLGKPQVSWVGSEPDPEAAKAAVDAVRLTPGAPALAADIVAAEGRVVAILQQHGYADAKPDPREVVVDHAAHTMTATFRIASGRLVHMDGIHLDVKGRTRPGWIYGLAPWRSGEVYKPDDVAELERRLLDTGVYDSVTVALAPAADADGLRPVVVSVADRSRHSFSVAAGYSTTEGPDLDMSWNTYNLVGRADTLSVFARAQEIDSRLGVTLSLPDWWNPNQTLKFGPDVFNEVTNAYTSTGAEFVADLTQRYGKTSFFTKGLSLVASRVDDVELGSIDIFSVRPLVAFAVDRTDNPLDAHHGWKLDSRAEPIGVFGDETLFYFKLQGQVSTYLPLDLVGDDVLAARLHAGSIIGGKIPQVPASDRFFAGGGGSVRGYEYQNVGPHYADNTPLGGLSVVDASVEYRRALFGNFGGVLFMDSGVVGSQAIPSFTHIASSFGVGLRYNLGFAPLRADFAFPLNRLSAASQPPIQVYLSIGQSF